MKWSRLVSGPLFLLILFTAAFFLKEVYPQNSPKIPEKDIATSCFLCHSDLKKRLRRKDLVKHAAASEGKCVACHNPHASDRKHLLAGPEDRTCYGCHKKQDQAFHRGHVHTPIRRGKCTVCHRPHVSRHQKLLVETGADLCYRCHEKERKAFKKTAVHFPVREGKCGLCHSPHASGQPAQIVKGTPALCLDCHDPAEKTFTGAHLRYPVERANCLECHDPHASDRKGLFRVSRHAPVMNRKCRSCHNPPESEHALGLIRTDTLADLCFRCHSAKRDRFRKREVHPPVKKGECNLCHTAHGASTKPLLKERQKALCLSCHDRVAVALAEVTHHHRPVAEGQCSRCHDPHASDLKRLMLMPAGIELCQSCHPTQGTFTHPVGKPHKDPRFSPDSGRYVLCTSCHVPHGSGFSYITPLDKSRDLCVLCHRK